MIINKSANIQFHVINRLIGYIMISQILLAVLLILFVVFVNYCWIKPRKILKFYANQLKGREYHCKVIPYKLFYNRFSDPIEQGKKVGDPLIYYKTQLPKSDVILSNIMNIPYIELIHIDFIKAYFAMDKHYDYPKVGLISGKLKRIFGPGVGLTEGHSWKQKRILLNKLFNFQFVKTQIPIVIEACDRCINQMENSSKKGQNQFGPFVQCHVLGDLLINIFSSVIITGFIGLKDRYEIDGVQVTKFLLHLLQDIGQHRIISPAVILGDKFYDLQLRKIDKSINQRQKKIQEWGHTMVKQQMKKVQAQMKNNKQMKIDNIIKAFMVYKKQNNTSDDIISQKDIFAQFIGFIFAGTDTTSNFLNVLLLNVAKNQQIERQLRKQINQFVKNDDYSYDNLKKLKYIQALQKQTTRVYGPINILSLRQTAQDNYLNGLAIKKGTLVTLNFFGNHYSQKYFKQPQKFRPQRWLNGQCDNLDPFVLVGFGGGPRTCLGKHLALLESKIALIKIMKRYKKISLLKQDFKWQIKLFTSPEYFQTRLTLNNEKDTV